MAPTPSWVVDDLSIILGLDDETIKQMIVPDLESYTHEARLRVHLQDFLGSTPQAKSFITRYTSLRFPSLASSSTGSIPSPSLTADPSLVKPTSKTKINASSKTPKYTSGPPSRTRSSRTASKEIPEVLEAAFGPGGKVYQKNRDLDVEIGWGGRASSSSAAAAGAVGTGTATPTSGSGSRLGLDAPSMPSSRTNSGKGKKRDDASASEKIWDKPKSPEIKRLENVLDNLRILREGEGKIKSPEQVIECFCQARVHPLSTYTPICQSCGLVLCTLQLPYLPCPSCRNPLSSPAQLARLILRLENEVELQLESEERERQKVERERLERLAIQAGGGAFPTLPGATPQQSITTTDKGGRKVISIGNKVKGKTKITTTTYIKPPPPTISANSSREIQDGPRDIVPRLRFAPIDHKRFEKELNKLSSFRKEHDKPFADPKAILSGKDTNNKADGLQYREFIVPVIQENGMGRRKKGKAKKLGEGGREVPGAG
uniref:TRIP4/RQT4 C2HC5-type zinc finger domain-containing protein n=1 Tax=Kwoniella dejecticola CBS 10117 TaxID=1296121 RepID=A0A1A6A7R4_9TREE|nr:uncharacterized protein I303_03814 [Kwoniella dejecticola CBS 10117]OBR86096.1 hypothetical protein I303_03814 [Kwoniella dejecticola CBS 10117]